MAECLQFAADGKVKADTELQPLSSINAVLDRLDRLDRLERGDVPSRAVLDFSGVEDAEAPAAASALVEA